MRRDQRRTRTDALQQKYFTSISVPFFLSLTGPRLPCEQPRPTATRRTFKCMAGNASRMPYEARSCVETGGTSVVTVLRPLWQPTSRGGNTFNIYICIYIYIYKRCHLCSVGGCFEDFEMIPSSFIVGKCHLEMVLKFRLISVKSKKYSSHEEMRYT